MTDVDPALAQHITADASRALAEDVGPGDLTAALVPAARQATAGVLVREPAVICGAPWFDEVCRQCDPAISVTWRCAEGSAATANTLVCELAGPAQAILTAERSALNFLQTLSATATAARAYSNAVADTGAVVLDTRKTLPGMRMAQKYAVRIGGASNHRVGLYDGILIKENHIMACGGVKPAVAAALTAAADVLVEVEVENLTEAAEAIAAGAHRLLLDNFTLDELRKAVALRDQRNPAVGLEASGGVALDTIGAIAATGVDFISVGALTKDVRAIDFSMRFELQ